MNTTVPRAAAIPPIIKAATIRPALVLVDRAGSVQSRDDAYLDLEAPIEGVLVSPMVVVIVSV